MATKEISHPVWNNSNTSDNAPNIRAMVKDIHNAFLTVNPELLTQTSDAGQLTEGIIDSWVLPMPTGSSASPVELGYFMYRYFDGVREIFIRASYKNLTSTYTWTFNIELGTATDGAGNITSRISNEVFQLTSGHSSENTTGAVSLFSCSEGFFGFTLRAFSTVSGTNRSQGHLHFSYPELSNGDIDNTRLIVCLSGYEGTSSITFVSSVVSFSAPGSNILRTTRDYSHTAPLSFYRDTFVGTGTPVIDRYYAAPDIIRDPNVCYVRYNQNREVFQYDDKMWIKQNAFMVSDGNHSCQAMRWE